MIRLTDNNLNTVKVCICLVKTNGNKKIEGGKKINKESNEIHL